MTRVLPCVLIVGALMLGRPAGASAQNRGFVGALGGVTFGTETSSIFGAQAGARIAPGLAIFGEVGRIQNVVPREIEDTFQELIEEFEEQTGAAISARLKVPAFYALVGLRWSTDASIAPFVEGGVGFARLTADIEATLDGVDVSDEIEAFLEDDSATDFLLGIGGGLNARLTDALRLDIGYRYTRIFTDEPAVNTSQVYGALKFWF